MKTKKIIFAIFILILCVLLFRKCIYPVISVFSKSPISVEDLNLKTNPNKNKYTDIFSHKAKNKLVFYDSFTSKAKLSYASLIYKNDYSIIVYEAKLKEFNEFDSLIHLRQAVVKNTREVLYSGYNLDGVEFSYSYKYDSLINKIYLIYEGEIENKTVLNKNKINFQFTANRIGFIYDSVENPFDMTFDAKSKRMKFNVTIIRQDNKMFVVVIYPREEVLPLNLDLVNEILL